MGRFDPTGPVDANAHSVASLRWETQLGALGPTDGSAGAASNVPSALSVLRHAQLYAAVSRGDRRSVRASSSTHAIRHGQLYPGRARDAAVLFATLRARHARRRAHRRSDRDVHGRVAHARGAAARAFPRSDRLAREATSCAGSARTTAHSCAIALRVPELRTDLLAGARVAERSRRSCCSRSSISAPLPAAPTMSRTRCSTTPTTRSADVRGRVPRALWRAHAGAAVAHRCRAAAVGAPALRNYVGELWTPTVKRPAVAPKLLTPRSMFAGEKVVLVKAGDAARRAAVGERRVSSAATSCRSASPCTASPKLALVTDAAGAVRVVEF